ncbi:MAG: head GIN domain-containing protein [Candidatus Obscuribacterales bacterium]
MKWVCVALMALSLDVSAVTVGSGINKSEQRPVSSFDRIELRGSGTLTINQNTTPSLTVKADDNLLREISTTVDNGVLIVKPISSIQPKTPIEYYVTVKNITEVKMEGTAKVKSNGSLVFDRLLLALKGATAADLVLQGKLLDITIDGTGRVDIVGAVDQQQVEIDGTGKYFAMNLRTKRTDITVNGTGKAKVYATEQLDARVNGAGKVIYRGSPQVTQKIRGSGSVTETNGYRLRTRNIKQAKP